ncbi:MAG: Ig-like domain-containing protein, partial [Oscillospiraceae bacterium]|nr:Ig-like domain-containing protein [Oscillospiraceae bacterium]
SVVLRKGMTYQININTNNLENIFYVSGNANATVSPTGLVTAVKTGTAIITVIDAWSQQYFTIAINITS